MITIDKYSGVCRLEACMGPGIPAGIQVSVIVLMI